MISTAITSALLMFGLAVVITFFVAVLIKVVFLTVRFISKKTSR